MPPSNQTTKRQYHLEVGNLRSQLVVLYQFLIYVKLRVATTMSSTTFTTNMSSASASAVSLGKRRRGARTSFRNKSLLPGSDSSHSCYKQPLGRIHRIPPQPQPNLLLWSRRRSTRPIARGRTRCRATTTGRRETLRRERLLGLFKPRTDETKVRI